MLKQISVKNLGCFDEQGYTVDFSEETLIAGPNNSGKSMLFAAMNLVRYYIGTGVLHWSSEYYNLWDFEASVYAHARNRAIEIAVKLLEKGSEYLLEFRLERELSPRLMLNRGKVGTEQARQEIDIVSPIWCFRPNRSPVQYQAQVRPTAGAFQPLRPDGSNVINYLLEKWTSRDKNWNQAESWLRKIDPDMSELKTPIRGDQVSLETLFGATDVNVSLQGSGFQSAAAIVSAVVFSPEGSTLIIEEPEVFLHPKSQEVIVDLLNDAVNNHSKQVIFSTHSCNVLLPFYSDVGLDGEKRSKEHTLADPKKFSMWTFEKTSGKVTIKPYPLHEKTFKNFREDFKYIWG